MHLAAIDQMANNGESIVHRAKGIYKISFSFVILFLVIFSRDIFRLGGVIAALIGMIMLSKIPIKEVFHLALYPIFFSLIFALFRVQESLTAGIIVVLKALGAALSMLFLITTTSYIEIFGLFSLFLPAILVDIFVFTYRSFFILLDRIENLMRFIRLRGGYQFFRILLNIKNISAAIGVMLIHSFDMSERMYYIYALRGYNGRIVFNNKFFPMTRYDAFLILLGILFIIWVVIPWNL